MIMYSHETQQKLTDFLLVKYDCSTLDFCKKECVIDKCRQKQINLQSNYENLTHFTGIIYCVSLHSLEKRLQNRICINEGVKCRNR